jgi:glutamine amidotransferase
MIKVTSAGELAMCRWLAQGPHVQLNNLLFTSVHSFIDQSIHSKLGAETTNGDGFASQVTSPLFFAHIRAAIGSSVQQTNCSSKAR